MPEIMNKEFLDKAKCTCGAEGCTGNIEVMRSKCHPDKGIHVAYRQGVMVLKCKECDQFIGAVQVASEREIPNIWLIEFRNLIQEYIDSEITTEEKEYYETRLEEVKKLIKGDS